MDDPQTIQLPEEEVEEIKKKNAVYTFSDGSGYISEELAELIAKKHGYQKCSAFQVRMGGIKGVLVWKPELDGRLIQVRKSQIKFPSESRKLEIIRCATFSQGYLNRQVIMLMSALGVPDDIFIDFLR